MNPEQHYYLRGWWEKWDIHAKHTVFGLFLLQTAYIWINNKKKNMQKIRINSKWNNFLLILMVNKEIDKFKINKSFKRLVDIGSLVILAVAKQRPLL